MIAGIAALLGLSLGILPGPPRVDVALGARTEAGTGYIPTTPSEPVSLGLQSTLTVRGGLRLLAPDQLFVLRAGPQLFWLVPNTAGLDRPLLFSSADAGYTTQLTRRLGTSLVASGGFGELSYATLSQVFVPGTGAVQNAIVPLAVANLDSRTVYRTTRLLTTTFGLRTSLQTPWSDGDAAPGAPRLPSFQTFAGEVTNDLRVTPIDSISHQLGAEFFTSDQSGNFLTVRTSAAWTHRTGPRSNVRGLFGAEWIRSSEPEDDYVLPQGSVDQQVAGGGRRSPWLFRSALGVRGFFDRLNFVYTPQAFARADVEKSWNPDFRSAFGVFGSTSISERPAAPGLFETFFGLEAPNRLRLGETLDLTFGLRASLRGLHLSEFDSSRMLGQLLVFVGLDWSEGTDRDHGAFVR